MNKSKLYKLEILSIKIMPFILATLILLDSLIKCFLCSSIILDYFYLMCVYIFVLLLSYSFKFCLYHRLPLHYVLIMKAIHIYDNYYPIEYSAYTKLNIYSIISCIFIFLTVYLYVIDNKESFRKNNK